MKTILTMSRAMLDLARRQEWYGLAELEAERRPLIHKFFESAPAEASAAVTEGIQEILDLDRVTMALAEAGRKEAVDALTQIATGKRAEQAYGEGDR